MKCRETQYWLYSFQPNAAWPSEVVGHLQQCEECQKIQAQLRQIDHQVNQLTTLPKNDRPLVQLFERLEKTSQTSAPAPKGPRRWPRWGLVACAAAALVAFGWLLGRFWETPVETLDPIEKIRTVEVVREKAVEVVRDKIVLVQSHADRGLVTLLLKRNARLVQSAQARDRLETLLDMADDCRQHALKLIDHGPRDFLPMTIDLYSQLLRQGVLVQLAQAPEQDRPMLDAVAQSRLKKMAEPVGEPVKTAAVLEQHRASLRTIALETSETANNKEEMAARVQAPKWRDIETAPASVALVQFAIAFSAETDPVVKADRCSDCVQRLMPYVMLHLADGPQTQGGEMGQQFGEMIRFGVYAPLAAATATAKEPAQPVEDQVNRVFQNADDAVAQMEKSLQDAPKAARPALERALDATKKGWEKNKGKGPAWKRQPMKKSQPKSRPGKTKAGQFPRTSTTYLPREHAAQASAALACAACSDRLRFLLLEVPLGYHPRFVNQLDPKSL